MLTQTNSADLHTSGQPSYAMGSSKHPPFLDIHQLENTNKPFPNERSSALVAELSSRSVAQVCKPRKLSWFRISPSNNPGGWSNSATIAWRELASTRVPCVTCWLWEKLESLHWTTDPRVLPTIKTVGGSAQER